MNRVSSRPTASWLLTVVALTLTAGCGSASTGTSSTTAATATTPASSTPSTAATASPASPAPGTASTGAGTAATASPANVLASDTEERNRRLVLTLYTGSEQARTAAVAAAAADSLIDHGVSGSTGAAALSASFAAVSAKVPGAAAPVVKRSAADGDLVAVQWQSSATPKDETTGLNVVDLYRFDGTKIVEHWQVTQAVPSSTTSGQSVFSDLYRYPNGAAPKLTEAQEEKNRTTLLASYERLFAGDFSVLSSGWSAEYIQHNPHGANGLESLRTAFTMMLSGGWGPASGGGPVTFPASLADGDLVWVFLAGYSGVDIFRVADGTVVEHWDVISGAGAH